MSDSSSSSSSRSLGLRAHRWPCTLLRWRGARAGWSPGPSIWKYLQADGSHSWCAPHWWLNCFGSALCIYAAALSLQMRRLPWDAMASKQAAHLARHCWAVRPGMATEIWDHWEPYCWCRSTRATSSWGDQVSRLIVGSRCLLQRPMHCNTCSVNRHASEQVARPRMWQPCQAGAGPHSAPAGLCGHLGSARSQPRRCRTASPASASAGPPRLTTWPCGCWG